MPRRFWIFKAHPLLKKIKNVAPIDMKIRQKTLKNSNILGNFILFVELFLYLSTRQEGPSIHCKVLFSSSSSALEWSSKNQFCLEPEHAAPQESWSLAELPNWLAKLSHTDLLSDSWSRSSNSFEKSRSENICLLQAKIYDQRWPINYHLMCITFVERRDTRTLIHLGVEPFVYTTA